MYRFFFRRLNNLKLRWKMMVLVLPLVIVPLFIVGGVVGYISSRQAYRGVTQTSKDDLDHMATFTLDLLYSHYQQFQVYRQDKRRSFKKDLDSLDEIAYNLAEAENRQYRDGSITLQEAQKAAREALKKVTVGATGYIYALNSKGVLKVHVAREGENIYDQKDGNGRYFIREMIHRARHTPTNRVQFITYPWRNPSLGDKAPRMKIAAYRYFKPWDWIIAASGYLNETYGDTAFERRSFAALKKEIKSIKVGRTGYIYCMTDKGTFTIHPDAEGKNFWNARDSDGHYFIREMCRKRSGWIRYPWENPGEAKPRMKIVRYAYFAPWHWIVAVGSYEDEFYHEANQIKWRTFLSMTVLTVLACLVSVILVSLAAKFLTDPIRHMIEVIRKVKQGRLDQQMQVTGNDEFGELAAAFNRMTDIIKRNREMETVLAQQGKMASLGVLSSGVAHEINNPLGVILGYASYLEGKLEVDHPFYRYIHEIKRESKRCKKIVQDLLSYARTPKPVLEPTDINHLLTQIVEFAANHTDMHHVRVACEFAPDLPPILVDGDQLRQVAINLILNAGAAMDQGGRLVVRTGLDEQGFVTIVFADNGSGISEENLERIFEPFFTTKTRGTGLGLAITRQIVEQHQGRISIASNLGEGTTITVRLPVQREEY